MVATTDLSFRAAAARVGCTHRAISVAVKAGRIPLQADGTLAPEAVDAWHASRRARRGGMHREVSMPDTKKRVRKAATSTSSTAGKTLKTLPRAVLAGGVYADRAAAELARDSYMARLRQLEYEEKRGLLLNAGEVRQAIGGATTRVRNRLLALPAEKAPALARLKSAAEMQSALAGFITEALEELVIGFADPPL